MKNLARNNNTISAALTWSIRKRRTTDWPSRSSKYAGIQKYANLSPSNWCSKPSKDESTYKHATYGLPVGAQNLASMQAYKNMQTYGLPADAENVASMQAAGIHEYANYEAGSTNFYSTSVWCM